MNAKAKIRVVAVILIGKDKPRRFFVAERADGAGWEFPGGKIEEGESPHQALIREIFEELGVVIDVQEYLDTSVVRVREKVIVMDLFAGQIVRGDITLREHLQSRWICEDEIVEFNWAPADTPLLDAVRGYLSRSNNLGGEA